MPRGRSNEDVLMLQMALIGYRHEKQRIDDKIYEIEARLKGRSSEVAVALATGEDANPGRSKRVLSASARKRIGAAQKKRWAEHRKRLAAVGQA